jgi:hypothetical protein
MSRKRNSPSVFRRWVDAFVIVICLAIAFAAVVFWVRSPRRFDYARLTTPHRQFLLVTIPHGLRFSTWPDPQNTPEVTLTSYVYFVKNAWGAWVSPDEVEWSKLGFGLRAVQFSNRAAPEPRSAEIYIPFWAVLFAAMLPPGILMVAWGRRSLRAYAGRCQQCGYDLRGVHIRCPECGAAAPQSGVGCMTL